MKLVSYNNAKSFLKAAEVFLLQNESLNNLMLGIAGRLLEANPDEGEPIFYVIYSEGQEVIGAAMRSAPIRPLALTSMNTTMLELIQRDLMDREEELSGLVGPKETIIAFAQSWAKDYKVSMDQGVYECDKLISAREFKGQFIKVKSDDSKALAAAIEFCTGFMHECFPNHPHPQEEGKRMAELYVGKGYIYLWQDGRGDFVSMAANHRESKNAGTIGWVFTPKDKRGQGYGSMVTHGVTQEIFNKGKKLANLYTDMNNPTSNSIYQKIGYRFIGESAHITF